MTVAFFPAPQPGETFYSVCSQYHRAVGASSAKATSMELLGLGSGFKYPDLPICLKHFREATGCEFGPEVVSTRSGLGPYLALMGARKSHEFFDACCKGSPALAKARSGLCRYTETVGLLKFCPDCLTEQLSSGEGTTHWLAAHQRAGAWYCEHHKRLLSYVRHPRTVTFGWKLPHDIAGDALTLSLSVEKQLEAWKLAEVMAWLADSRSVSTSTLQIMLRWRLRMIGLVRTEQKWHRAETDHLCNRARQYAVDFGVPDVSELGRRDWMRALLGDVRHYDALAWGLGIAFTGKTDRRTLAAEYLDAQHRTPERELFQAERTSQNTAPAALYEAFDGAASLDAAADKCPLDRGEVVNWLRRDSQLHALWNSTKLLAKHDKAVRDLALFLRQFPSARRVDVLRNRASSYRWLLVHDPDRLHQMLPQPALPFAKQLHFNFPVPGV